MVLYRILSMPGLTENPHPNPKKFTRGQAIYIPQSRGRLEYAPPLLQDLPLIHLDEELRSLGSTPGSLGPNSLSTFLCAPAAHCPGLISLLALESDGLLPLDGNEQRDICFGQWTPGAKVRAHFSLKARKKL